MHGVHSWGWVLLAALVAIHLLAALNHHFIAKDGVLKRMLRPGSAS